MFDEDYTAKIAKKDLEHGAYYRGQCRNATEARWNAERDCFVHWRYKWAWYLENIKHPEDDEHYDVFVVEERITNPVREIPFD